MIFHLYNISFKRSLLSHHLQDRFAPGRVPPVIDEQQDWDLVGGEEESGFTILEFSRKYITCDDKDLPITVSH